MCSRATHWVSSVAFSSDCSRIVSGSHDKSVRVWDALKGEVLNVLEGHTNLVSSVAFLTDGRQVICGSGVESVTLPCYIREKTLDSTGHQTHTGWLLSAAGEGYLMFVPLEALLPDSANILTIPQFCASSVDFTGADLGPEWHNCYSL